jgi:Ser/Thr protein kinase RdoA (MazF antagonist)
MDNGLLQNISAEYGWNDPVLKAVNSGLINYTWKVDAGERSYVLQAINTKVFAHPEWIDENLNRLATYLKKEAPSYLFTAPVKTNKGNSLVEEAGNFYRVFDWIPGSHTIDVVDTPQQAYEAANAFGTFTNLLKKFDVAVLHCSLPGFHNLSLRYRQFEKALQDGDSKRIASSSDIIKYLVSRKPLVAGYEAFIASPEVKQRVTHHDTKISNVLFDKHDNSRCVIDLDTVMPGYFLSDVGDMIRTYVCPVSEEEQDLDRILIRKEYVNAIENGFLNNMNTGLSAFEKDHFYFGGAVLIYMQALRFITDHLQNDQYYGARYPDHNKMRAANQARLLALFESL